MNAFAACMHAADAHAPVFPICEGCSTIAEAAGDALRAQLEANASGLGFRVWRSNMEAVGLCPACAVAA